MVWRVGEVHGFKADCRAAWIADAFLADLIASQSVGSVDLNGWLSGEYGECAAALGVVHPCSREAQVASMDEAELVVVAIGDFQLFVVGVNPFAYRVRLGEVERSALHFEEFARNILVGVVGGYLSAVYL